jgi:hypothetical protein
LHHTNEGSIPFTRSIQLQQLARLCRKSAGELKNFQIIFAWKWRANLRPERGKIIKDKIPREFLFHHFEKNLSGAGRQTWGRRTSALSGIIGGAWLLQVLRETACRCRNSRANHVFCRCFWHGNGCAFHAILSRRKRTDR